MRRLLIILTFPILWYFLTQHMRSSHPSPSCFSDLSNQTYVVTGGTSGIGSETVEAFLKCGAHVVVGSRHTSFPHYNHSRVHTIPLDLASISSASSFLSSLSSLQKSIPPVRAFVLNGGVFSKFHSVSSHTGIETTFQVNYLTHFHMVRELLTSNKNLRIVAVVSSSVYYWSTSSLDPEQNRSDYAPFRAYANSKASLYRMVMELSRMGVESYAVHPGLIHTSLGSKGGVVERFFASLFWYVSKTLRLKHNSPLTRSTFRYSIAPFTKSTSQGASTQVFCATAPSSELTSGGWYVVFEREVREF